MNRIGMLLLCLALCGCGPSASPPATSATMYQFQHGHRAYRAGAEASANPYLGYGTLESERLAWLNGWMTAAEEAQAAKRQP